MTTMNFSALLDEIEVEEKGQKATAAASLCLDSVPKVTQTTAIDLDVTDGCNLACTYCFKNLNKPHNMTLDTAKQSIEWLILASGDSPQVSVNFMGGEPLLRFKLLRDLVAWARRRCRAVGKEASFSFTTNLTLFTDEIRRWVDEEGIGVLMSIDGLPEVQDTQRPAKSGKPMAGVVAKWARSMLQTRPQADARLTISPSCVARLFDSCVYLWEEIGFTNVVMADSAYELWTDEDIATYDRQIGLLVDYLAADFEAGGKKNIAVLSIFMKRLVMPRDKSTQIERRNFPCGAGYNYSMIDHKGDIWPCHRFDGAAEDSGTEESMRMGNIFNGSYNDKLSNVFRNFDHSKVFKPPCKTCPVEPICGGFCPAANLQHNGDLYRPHDVYCSLKWILYRHAEILYKRLNNISATRAEEFLRDVRETSETA